MKKWIFLAIALLLLFSTWCFYFVFTTNTNTPLLPDSFKSSIKLTFNLPEETIALEKRGDQWNIIYPVYSTVDKDAFETILQTLQSSTVGGIVSNDQNTFSNYEVDNQESRRIDITNNLGATFSVYIGRKIEHSMYSYTRISGENAVRTSSLPYDIFANISSLSLRSKQALAFSAEDVLSMDVRTIEGAKKTLVVEATDEQPQLEKLLSELLSLQVERYHSRSDGAPYPEELRETYEYKLYLTLNDGNTETLYLKSVDNISYVYKEGAEEIAIIPPSFYEMLRELFL